MGKLLVLGQAVYLFRGIDRNTAVFLTRGFRALPDYGLSSDTCLFPGTSLFPDSGLFSDYSLLSDYSLFSDSGLLTHACQPADIGMPGSPVFPKKRLCLKISGRCLSAVLCPRQGTASGLRADLPPLNRLLLFRHCQHTRLLPIRDGSAHI